MAIAAGVSALQRRWDMTEEERLINETWPRIRETVERMRPTFHGSRAEMILLDRPIRQQMSFWLAMSQLEDLVDERVVEVARKAREGIHDGRDV